MATGWDAGPQRAASVPHLSEPQHRPSLIAHRGFAGEHPENTASAIRAAADEADWIELDCRPTADGAVAVFHDHVLDRCTSLSGPVSEISSNELFSTSVLGGEPVLSLPDALSLIPPETGIVLDLKGRSGTGPSGVAESWGWIDRVVSILECVSNPVLVSTFWEGALAALDGRLPSAFLFEEHVEEALSVADRYGCRAIHPPAELIIGASIGRDRSVDLLARAAELGLAVNAWTVTTRYMAAALASAGVDGIISDYGDVLVPRARTL